MSKTKSDNLFICSIKCENNFDKCHNDVLENYRYFLSRDPFGGVAKIFNIPFRPFTLKTGLDKCHVKLERCFGRCLMKDYHYDHLLKYENDYEIPVYDM